MSTIKSIMPFDSSAAYPPPPLRRRSLLLFLTFVAVAIFNVGGAFAGGESTTVENPFTPKAYLLRYWRKQISNDLPKPDFLLDKASPLTATDYAAFSKLAADQNSLSAHLPDFCSKANLLCFPDLSPNLEKHDGDVNFATYLDQNFTNYGTNRRKGSSAFSHYSENDNVVSDTFRRYSRGSSESNDAFDSYATNSNVVDQSFNSYGTNANEGEGDFTNYNNAVNIPDLQFTAYSDRSYGHKQTFTTYSNDFANVGGQDFKSYGKHGSGVVNEFTAYSVGNLLNSSFSNYGELGNGESDTFTTYGNNTNVPENTFSNYAAEGTGESETFTSYRDGATSGDDTFDSYGKKSTSSKIGFVNYGNSFFVGTDNFTGYGEKSINQETDFKIYSLNSSFKEYSKQSTTTFSSYTNQTVSILPAQDNIETSATSSIDPVTSGKKVNRWVEPGKFFRESMLKPGTIMPMPDIRDKMPKRSFLPRLIVSKLPFSTSEIAEIKKIFHAGEDDSSSMSKMVNNALKECERSPSPGETKRCVASIEDMIDFATAVLGRSVVARTTATTEGSNGQILLGQVRGINGGRVTQSVSCHQSLYPYLLYYCHSVPKVRVYEADILDPNTKSRINHGVAICHVDTSSWSQDHGAFIALGSGPGKIEVCHWIFENDLTWAIAD